MTNEIELTSNETFASLENWEGFSKTVEVTNSEGKKVLRYKQYVELEEIAWEEDLQYDAFLALDNAQKEFIKSMMNDN